MRLHPSPYGSDKSHPSGVYYIIKLMNSLYIVATPIGNLEDISIRAIKILLISDVIACEDTRKTGMLLKNYESKILNQEWNIKNIHLNNNRKLLSFYDEVEEIKTEEIIDQINQGKTVSLVSDSGTPLISDPGYKLVKSCLDHNIKVISIPGPTAAISALVSCGLAANQFLFLGFIPQKSGKRQKLFTDLKKTIAKSVNPTIVFYESPHRIYNTLEDIKKIFGDIEIVIARELTKVHEEISKNRISEFLNAKINLKGEITLLFNFKTPQE